MRPLLLLALFASTAAAAPRLGPWGEDPTKVPPFALPQERRAPKVPAGADLHAHYGRERRLGPVEGALLVCHVAVAKARPKSLGGALRSLFTLGMSDLRSVTVRLRAGSAPEMVAWGPELHDKGYVSFPAVELQPGGRISAALVDRNLLSRNEGLGRAAITWQGESPFTVETRRWRLGCVVLDGPEARREAQSWLDRLDRQLAALAERVPDAGQLYLGYPETELHQLKGMFKSWGGKQVPFRYAAGFLGWGHPEIQARLQRLADFEADWRTRAAAEVARLAAEAPPLPETLSKPPFELGRPVLRCDARDRCTVEVPLRHTEGAPASCHDASAAVRGLSGLDAAGEPVGFTVAGLRDAAGGRACPVFRMHVPRPGPFTVTLRAAGGGRPRVFNWAPDYSPFERFRAD